MISDAIYERIRSGTADPVIIFEGILTARNIGSDRRMSTSRAGPSIRDNIQDNEESGVDTIVAYMIKTWIMAMQTRTARIRMRRRTTLSRKPSKPRYFLPSKLEYALVKTTGIPRKGAQNKVAI